MKYKGRKFHVASFTLAILICLCMHIIFTSTSMNVALAENSNSADNLENICEEYTKSLEFIDDGGVKRNVLNYEAYLNTRFNIGHSTTNIVTDEWIFHIVPRQLFEQKKTNYLYFGAEYGFYFNYNSSDNSYLIYFIEHHFDTDVSGHLVRKITPLYYERYIYDFSNKTAALEFDPGSLFEGRQSGYIKYSNVKNLYLKNISFSGNLINENHLNIDEQNYVADSDMGGYFVGGSYKFDGVSTQSGKTDFKADVFKTRIGYIPGFDEVTDLIDLAVDMATIIQSGENWMGKQKSNFRKEISNEFNEYTFNMLEIDATAQIDEYSHLLKNRISETK